MIKQASSLFVALGLTFSNTSSLADSNSLQLEPILTDLTVSVAQKLVQQTPVAIYNGAVYLTAIEPGKNGDIEGISLHTVIRKGMEVQGDWSWESNIIDKQTAHDAWHTPPSVGVDEKGFIHVAYNMHNLPWQYKVSTDSETVSNFHFKGQEITKKELSDYFTKNKTQFPSAGSASIPGNQITYPAFYNGRNGELFVTYRFAAKPAKRFSRRTMSAGAAQYDASKKRWTSLGGATRAINGQDYIYTKESSNLKAIATEEGWTASFPRLAFATDNTPLAQVFWIKGIAGPKIGKPCFVSLASKKSLPLTPSTCSNMEYPDGTEFNASGNIASDSAGRFYSVLSPVGEIRQLVYQTENGWLSEDLPYSASEIAIDANDNLWAFASGLRVFKREAGSKQWQKVIDANERINCSPRVTLDASKETAYIYSPGCNQSTVSLFRLKLTGSD